MTYSDQRTQSAELDRRNPPRAFGYTRPNQGRRRARRTCLFEEVFWQRADDPTCRRGILVGVSGTGLGLVTEHDHEARAGMQITPSRKGRSGRWREPVVVTRVDRLSDTLDLVAAKYPEPARAMAYEGTAMI